MVVVTEKASGLISEGDDLLEDRNIDIRLKVQLAEILKFRYSSHLVGFRDGVLAASIGIDSILDERKVMVVLKGQLDFALIFAGTLLQGINVNVVRRNSLEFLRSEPDGTLLLVKVF